MSWAPTADDVKVLDELRSKLGINDSSIIRLGLRRLHEQEFPQAVANAAD